MVTYDGSSQAKGFRLYQDGKELATEVKQDNLYKDIILTKDIMLGEDYQPGLQIGARDRGKGIGGSVVDNILVFDRELTPIEVALVTDRTSLSNLIQKSSTEFSEEESQILQAYFLANYSRRYQAALKKIEQARSEYADRAEVIQEMMVMKEMPGRRKTYVLERGRYDSYGEEVFPNTPESILPMPQGLPPQSVRLGTVAGPSGSSADRPGYGKPLLAELLW